MMRNIIKQAFMVSIVLLLLCGIIYPLAITGIGQLMFNKQANGSIVSYNGKAIGSSLIGQNFTDKRFFYGRVSSINYNTYTKADTIKDKNSNVKYTGAASGSSNYAPSNSLLKNRIQQDIEAFLKTNPGITKSQIPADLLTNSGSGLDPEISIAAAKVEIPLIAQKTGISVGDLQKIVDKNTKGRFLGIFGEERVNVLECNMDIAKKLNIK